MWPVAKPLSMLLDWIFGKELNELFDKHELEALLEEHSHGTIDTDEQRIMIGAMKFSDKKAIDVITPVTVMFRLEAKTLLNDETIAQIMDEHYSRIPIYDKTRDNIIGILYAKDLVGYERSMNKTVEDMCRKTNLLFIPEDCGLDALLNHFVKSKTHMSFVFDQFHSLTGIVTLEDIVEEILKIEILDENDTVADLQHLAKNTNRISYEKDTTERI
jgi:metal transporter CNNM